MIKKRKRKRKRLPTKFILETPTACYVKPEILNKLHSHFPTSAIDFWLYLSPLTLPAGRQAFTFHLKMNITLDHLLRRNQELFYPVVPFDSGKDKLFKLDLTENNTDLTPDIYSSTELFSKYVDNLREKHNARYLFGGYDELRQMYGRSELFGVNNSSNVSADEPRRLHLGVDIWGPAGTPISVPLGGTVHSFAFNNRYGDYGATIILMHQLDGYSFYSLYGHLSLKDIYNMNAGTYLSKGAVFAHFGNHEENGQWPPHLHFQLIHHIGMYVGDYPGVCKFSEREKYLDNCPDPEIILQFNTRSTAAH